MGSLALEVWGWMGAPRESPKSEKTSKPRPVNRVSHIGSGHLAGGCWWRSPTKRKLDNQASDHKRTHCFFEVVC